MPSKQMQLPLFETHEAVVRPLSRKDHLTFRANVSRGRHGWLRLTPAYSVTLVNELVAQCSVNDMVLDPFAGSGTTALACAEADIHCATVDINPFLVWLARVKCESYSSEDILSAQGALADALGDLSRIPREEAWTPPIKDIEKWWPQPVLGLIANIFASMDESALPIKVRDLLLVVFCRGIIELASVSFGHQSMSFKKSSPASFLSPDEAFHRVRSVFELAGELVVNSAPSPVHVNRAQAILGDSRELPNVLPRELHTVVITSPPYPNRMSYIRELRPYMYWLGYLSTGREAEELDWQAIGGTWGCATSNLMKWEPPADAEVSYPGYHQVIHDITAKSPVLGRYVDKYFRDTVRHIEGLKLVLAPSARVNYIIGNSRFYDVMLHTEQIYAAIFAAGGFEDVSVEAIRKRTSKKELFEYNVSGRLSI